MQSTLNVQRWKKMKKEEAKLYLELDGLLEDRGAAGGLVLRPEAVLRHNTVAEGRDLPRQRDKG